MSAEALRRTFEQAKGKDAETQVVVQADEATHHGRVVAVMELAKAAGLRRLAIATRRAR
jgi:biopolymer transport protein ExbD